MSMGFSYEQAFRGPHVGTALETSENTFYWYQHPLNIFSGGTFDGAARDSGNAVTDVLRPGLLLGRVYSTGKLKEWSPTATDGSQFIFGILDNPGMKMQANGTNQDRFRGNVMVRGQVNPARLLVPGQASFGITGTTYEYLIRQQLNMAGFILSEDPASSGLMGYGTSFLWNFRSIQAKTADYTVKAYESGTLFTTRGAAGAVNFTLPTTASLGLYYGFYNVADQSMLVASGTADKVVAFNDQTADSVAFSTSSEKIGGSFVVVADGTGWLVFPFNFGLGTTAQTVTVAT
jgi:hypothetical protein